MMDRAVEEVTMLSDFISDHAFLVVIAAGCVIAVVFVLWRYHVPVFVAALAGCGIHIAWRKVYDPFLVFRENKLMVSDGRNWTAYPLEFTIPSDRRLKKFEVFKKCDKSKNVYFWDGLYGFSDAFYTSDSDEKKTLENILAKSSVKRQRKGLVHAFFEASIVSWLLQDEDPDTLSFLTQENYVTLRNGYTLVTEIYFRDLNEGKADVLNIRQKFAGGTKTPDLLLFKDHEGYIIDAYDGTSEKEVPQKITMYTKEFPNCTVAVIASGIGGLQQLSLSRRSTFTWDALDKDAITPFFRSLLDDFCSNGPIWKAYAEFVSEIHYWILNESQSRILKSGTRE